MKTTTTVFMSGKSQAIRIPKAYRLTRDKVDIKRVGNILLIYAEDDTWEEFLNSEPVSDDFGEAIFDARKKSVQPQREAL